MTAPNELTIIGEVKTESPYGYITNNSWEEQFEFCNKHADWISIHTDPRWGGSFNNLKYAKKYTNKPVLAKGIHKLNCRLEKALNIADYALVVDRVPTKLNSNYNDKILFETDFVVDPKKKMVWNQRDLETGKFRGGVEKFREKFDGWLCQASGIETFDDVCEGVDAVLVGTHFRKFIRSFKNEIQ